MVRLRVEYRKHGMEHFSELKFSNEYRLLRTAQANHTFREENTKETAINERLVACLWFSGRYLRNLKTVDGRKIEIISPGVWNLEAGPDFRQAAIKFDGGEPVRGDVEIHLYASDWSGHQHHKRDEYAGVVLNVSLWNNVQSHFLPSSIGKGIPHVELEPFLTRPVERVASLVETEDYPYRSSSGTGRCAGVIESLKKDELYRLLQMAGEWRIQEKASRFRNLIQDGDYDRTLYHALMESMGYQNNKAPFATLAELLPYEMVAQITERCSGKPSPYQYQALLMNLSGLFPAKVGSGWDEETAGYHKFIRGIRLDLNVPDEVEYLNSKLWNLRGRPVNNPLRRIAGISLFLHHNRNRSPFGAMLSVLKSLRDAHSKFRSEYERFTGNLLSHYFAQPGRELKKQYQSVYKRLLGIIEPGEDKYWSYRYTLGGKKLPKPCALIGAERLRDISVNVILPMLLVHARERHPDDENLLYAFSQFLPRLPDNRITRMMKHRLFGRNRAKIPKETAMTQQGLLQLFKDFCSNDRGGCIDCEFVSNIENWMEYRERK